MVHLEARAVNRTAAVARDFGRAYCGGRRAEGERLRTAGQLGGTARGKRAACFRPPAAPSPECQKYQFIWLATLLITFATL